MKKFIVNEEDRMNILKMHQAAILNEQGGLSTLSTAETKTEAPVNRTIQDLQALVGATPDNVLGPKTLEALKNKITTVAATKAKTVTPEKKDEVDPSLIATVQKLKSMEKTPEQIVQQLKGMNVSDEIIAKIDAGLKPAIEKIEVKPTETKPEGMAKTETQPAKSDTAARVEKGDESFSEKDLFATN